MEIWREKKTEEKLTRHGDLAKNGGKRREKVRQG